jgi:hypothetical protein
MRRQSRAIDIGAARRHVGAGRVHIDSFGHGLSTYLLLRVNLLKLATFFSFLAVIFYTALAGAMVPTVRSAIMIGVYELAVLMNVRKKYSRASHWQRC